MLSHEQNTIDVTGKPTGNPIYHRNSSQLIQNNTIDMKEENKISDFIHVGKSILSDVSSYKYSLKIAKSDAYLETDSEIPTFDTSVTSRVSYNKIQKSSI